MEARIARGLALSGAGAGDGAVWLGGGLGVLLQAPQLPLIVLGITQPIGPIRDINHAMSYALPPIAAIGVTQALYMLPALAVAAALGRRGLLIGLLIAAGLTSIAGWHLYQAAHEDALSHSPNRLRVAAFELGMNSIRA